MQPDEDGSFFIDRDGSLFHYLLNFLRDPATFYVPADDILRMAIWWEADFFQLNMWSTLFPGNMPPLSSRSYMSSNAFAGDVYGSSDMNTDIFDSVFAHTLAVFCKRKKLLRGAETGFPGRRLFS